MGDLRYGRTIHSLLFLLGLYQNVEIHLIAPTKLGLPEKYLTYLRSSGLEFHDHETLDVVDSSFDVVYVTRVQKERFESKAEYDRLKDYLVID